jgi:hypothetical protein
VLQKRNLSFNTFMISKDSSYPLSSKESTVAPFGVKKKKLSINFMLAKAWVVSVFSLLFSSFLRSV